MRSTGVFHPDFFYHARPVVGSTMIADVEIYEPTEAQSKWEPGVGNTATLFTLRYKGKARIQPNKDWRARAREQGLEFGATHAIRVQLEFGSNELTTPEASEDFKKDWKVVVKGSHVLGTERLEGGEYYVRNASLSSNAWVHNLLCDTNTRE